MIKLDAEESNSMLHHWSTDLLNNGWEP